MKRVFIVFLIIFAISCSGDNGKKINGKLIVIGDQRILHLWGTNYEMGYAHGYIMGAEIKKLLNDYAATWIRPDLYPNAVRLFNQIFYVPQEYMTELEGMLQGMRDSGVDMYLPIFNKQIELIDLMIGNAIADISGLFHYCSSFSAWGDATFLDPSLQGNLAIFRNLDFNDNQNHDLAKARLIIAYEPSSPNKQKWVSIAFSGIIGCLSCMNENGLGAFLNLSNGGIFPRIGSNCVPTTLTLRTGIESVDYNQDMKNSIYDVYQALSDNERAGSFDIHLVSNYKRDQVESPALIAECRFGEIADRLPEWEPELAPYFLVATNHHRKIMEPIECPRYEKIVQRLTEDYRVDKEEGWDILKDVAVSGTLQTMIFFPHTKELYIAFATEENPAPYCSKQHYTWEELFSGGK